MRFFTVVIALAGLAAAENQLIDSLLAGPGKLPLPPAASAALNQAKDFLVAPCAQKCVTGAYVKSGCSITKPDPNCLCRTTFQAAFEKCAQAGCPANLFQRAHAVQRALCTIVVPPCVIGCLGEKQVKTGCGLDMHCQCAPEYMEDFHACLRNTCTDRESILRELVIGKQVCDLVPPKCAYPCLLKSGPSVNCFIGRDPKCVCQPKLKEALTTCLATSTCTREQSGIVVENLGNACTIAKVINSKLPPSIKGKLETYGALAFPANPGDPSLLQDYLVGLLMPPKPTLPVIPSATYKQRPPPRAAATRPPARQPARAPARQPARPEPVPVAAAQADPEQDPEAALSGAADGPADMPTSQDPSAGVEVGAVQGQDSASGAAAPEDQAEGADQGGARKQRSPAKLSPTPTEPV